MVTGGLVLALGIGVILYGLWVASQGIRTMGRLPPGTRQLQFCGMGLAVGGIGISMLSFGNVVADVIGALLILQATAMIAYSGRIEKYLR